MAEEGAAPPNPRQGQDHEAGQRHVHINLSNLNQNFQGSQKK